MKEIVVLSGKGGVGKTSIAAGLISFFDDIVITDCDVDAANLHLLLKHEVKHKEDFYSGYLAEITDACNGCGICQKLCRFDAISPDGNKFKIAPLACEGCGVCVDHCPEEAINFFDRLSGDLFESSTEKGPFSHAHLGPGGENSGKLVSTVRKRAKDKAKELGKELIISDGPPGIGCPVIASMTGASAILVVAEPSKSSIHDMERVLALCRHFNIKPMVCINKADLNPALTREILERVKDLKISYLGSISTDEVFYQAQLQGKPVTEFPDSKAAGELEKIWHKLKEELEQL